MRDDLSKEFGNLSLNGEEKLLRGKGVEVNVLDKVMTYMRTNKYE